MAPGFPPPLHHIYIVIITLKQCDVTFSVSGVEWDLACSALSVVLDNMVEGTGEQLPSWRQSGSLSVLCGHILICMVYNKALQCITSTALSTD